MTGDNSAAAAGLTATPGTPGTELSARPWGVHLHPKPPARLGGHKSLLVIAMPGSDRRSSGFDQTG